MCGTFLLIAQYRRSIEKENCAKYYNGDRKFGFLVERGYIYIYMRPGVSLSFLFKKI